MPNQPVEARKRTFARSMRREPTETEEKLWHEARGRQPDRIKFRRQVPTESSMADFARRPS